MTELRGVFVTGTDTGVGKTYIGTAVIPALMASGVSVIPRKPVESGCEILGDELIPADAVKLHAAAGQPGSLHDVCPYRLNHTLSPERAARLEGVHLTIADLERACRKHIDDNGFLWVEGAGGFYSPLARDGLNADLAARLDLPVLLVAADRLGCINHVLLTVDAIRARGLSLVAIFLNQNTPDIAAAMNNAMDLRQRLDDPLLSSHYLELRDSLCPQTERLIKLLNRGPFTDTGRKPRCLHP